MKPEQVPTCRLQYYCHLLEHFYCTLVMIVWKHVTLGGKGGGKPQYAPTVPLNWCVTKIKISRGTENFYLQRHNVNCACACWPKKRISTHKHKPRSMQHQHAPTITITIISTNVTYTEPKRMDIYQWPSQKEHGILDSRSKPGFST